MMDDGLPLRPEKLRVVYRLIALWLMGWIGIIAWQALAWTDLMKGLHHGVIAGGLVSPFLLLLTAPLGAMGWSLGKLRRFSRYQLAASLMVPAAAIFSPAVSALMDRMQPERRFERFTGVPLPAGVKFDQVSFEGGLFPANYDKYIFTCSPKDAVGLIGELKLEYRGDGGNEPIGASGKTIHEVYSREDSWKFVSLYADSTRSVVEVTCGYIEY
jgi:hypothetical protein